jgi:hypothetical protein
MLLTLLLAEEGAPVTAAAASRAVSRRVDVERVVVAAWPLVV